MNRISMMTAAAALALAGACFAETWKGVAIVDVACSAKVKDNPDAHTRECGLQCAKSGFGIVTADGTFLKLDAKGNDLAVAALQATRKTDVLRVTVNGKRVGDTVHVASLRF